MNINISTELKKNKKTVDTLSVVMDTEELTKIVKTKGLAAGNQAINKFVARYTEDLKKKLAAVINQ
jgi:hypothetical protein